MAQSVWALNTQPKPILDDIHIDPAWQKCLPPRSTILGSTGHGSSFWSQTARIDCQLEDGDTKSFFLKLASIYEMVRGEFESMQALHRVAPQMIPKPAGFGTCKQDPTTHFFLCDFVDVLDELPDIVDFCKELAEMHRKSMTFSDGRFGFPVITCNGTVPQRNEWTISWENFFVEALKYEFSMESAVQGPSDEIEEMLPDLLTKVCPRLLRPLETEGRDLKPCLVHGDCWDGNIAIDADTGQAYIYDSSAFWGHNEYEMHMWRGERYRLRKSYVKEYFRHFPISPPEADWDDRNLLYSLRADLHDSILFPATKNFRRLIVTTMRALVEKFPDGFTGTAPCKDTQVFPNLSSVVNEDEAVQSQHGQTDSLQEAILPSKAKRDPLVNASPSIDELLHEVSIAEEGWPPSQTTPPDPVLSPADSSPEIRFGESAFSSSAGSTAGIQ